MVFPRRAGLSQPSTEHVGWVMVIALLSRVVIVRPEGCAPPASPFYSTLRVRLASGGPEHPPAKSIGGRGARTRPPEHVPSSLAGWQLCVRAGTLEQGFIQHTNPHSVDDDELLPVGVGEERPGRAGPGGQRRLHVG